MDPIYVYYIQKFIIILAQILNYAILARIILSWASMGGQRIDNPITRFIYNFSNPLLNFFKKFPHRIGMIDISPIIAIFAIDMIQKLLIYLLAYISR